LEPRDEPGLEWCRVAAGACFQGSLAAQRAVYGRIFRYEKPRIAAILGHHRQGESLPALRFVIGNEPNFYPYVDPGVFAEVYRRYRDYIREPEPAGLGCSACRVNAGGVLLVDPLGGASLAGAFLEGTLGLWSGLRGWFGAPVETGFLPYRAWLARFLAALEAQGGRLDGLDVHVYAIDAKVTLFPGLGPPLLRLRADTAALDTVAAMLRGCGAPPIWVGEFGSVHPFQSGEEVGRSMEALVAHFRRLPQVERWFWYAAAGTDPKFPGGRIRFGGYAWSFATGPQVGLYGDPADAKSRTPLGERYLRLMAAADEAAR
jgi:hypothetical protein